MSYYATKTTYEGGNCGGLLLSVEVTPYLGTCVRYKDASSTTENYPFQRTTAVPNTDQSYSLTTKYYASNDCSGSPGTSIGSLIPSKTCSTGTDSVTQVTTSSIVSFSASFPTPLVNFDGYRIDFWPTDSCASTPVAMLAVPLQTCLYGGLNVAKYSKVSACSENTYRPRLYSDPECERMFGSPPPPDSSSKLPVCLEQKNLTNDASINYPFGMYSGYRAYGTTSCLKAYEVVQPIDLVAIVVSTVCAFVVAAGGSFYYLYIYKKKPKGEVVPSILVPPGGSFPQENEWTRPSEHTAPSPSMSVHPESSPGRPRVAASAFLGGIPPAPKQKEKQGW